MCPEQVEKIELMQICESVSLIRGHFRAGQSPSLKFLLTQYAHLTMSQYCRRGKSKLQRVAATQYSYPAY